MSGERYAVRDEIDDDHYLVQLVGKTQREGWTLPLSIR
jgi:hypothetical protein